MSWLSTGTAKVVNGNTRVEFAGVDLIANKVAAGDAFALRGSFNCEIARIVSATVLELVYPWISASADGAAYTIQPTVARINDLNTGVGDLLRTFTDVRDLAGRGMFADGTAAAPGVRFVNDQDTGWRRPNENILAMVAGGVDRLTVDNQGAAVFGSRLALSGGTASNVNYSTNIANWSAGVADGSNRWRVVENQFANEMISITGGGVGIGTTTPAQALHVARGDVAAVRLSGGGHSVELAASSSGYAAVGTIGSTFLDLVTNSIARGRITADGMFLFGTTSFSGLGVCHRVVRSVAQGNALITFDNGSSTSLYVTAAGAEGFNAAASAIKVGRNTDTGRSVTSGGTINASGADYAEYMVKAAGCGIIAKGDVCGVDRDGKLTKSWEDAIGFVIKSTDPSLVGGDTWDAEVGPKPEQPGAEPIEPPAPVLQDDADNAATEAYREALAAYPGTVSAYRAEHAAWKDAMAAYAVALKAWEAEHEKARQCVDRIAFCGQVPANVSGDFEVGDYIIAAASGAGIKAVAVKADDMTLPQYMRRIGKVWAIRDGRAWIDVQHG